MTLPSFVIGVKPEFLKLQKVHSS